MKKKGGLHRKLLIMTLVPLFVMGCVIALFSYFAFAHTMQKEVERGLQNMALMTLYSYDNMYPGDYMLKEEGEAYFFYKGETRLSGNNHYIDKIKEEEIIFLEDEIKSLHDLDDYSKISAKEPVSYVIGTKMDRIDGILDRISLLREDFKLKYMFNKSSENNIDFAKELEAGKLIIIRMPQDKFSKHSKNVITTFLLSKVWIATEIRGGWNKQPRPTHISVDEIFQTRTAMQMLADSDILPQTRKFGCKFILSCQSLNQVEILSSTLEEAGASYMMMGGTSEKDFKHFENKIDGFEYEDLRDMPQYSSLNLIYYSGGYASFISKLPKPIKKRRKLKLNIKYKDVA